MSDSPQSFIESALWKKLFQYAKVAGRTLVEQSLVLVHTLKDSDTPVWARGTILSALAYFISPLDIIPDFIPIVGYADDLTALAAAAAAVAIHIKKEHREKARSRTDEWFGPRVNKGTESQPPPQAP